MEFFLIYFGTGVAVFVALWLWFRKTGVDPKGLRTLWLRPLAGEGFIFVFLFWPIVALFSLMWWVGERLHLHSKKRESETKIHSMKQADRYSHMTMDELLAEQQKVANESQKQK